MSEEIDLEESEEETEEAEEEEVEMSGGSEPSNKDRDKSKRYELYEEGDEKVERLRKSCPRCGPGIFLADHGERLSCGKCGYTEFKKDS